MQAVEKYISEISFSFPEYLVHSTWMEHGPFAFWLVEATRPRTIVELGVFRGYSYFCFNQAAQKLGLKTRVFGIDTWAGDEHGGFYGDEIYNPVKAENGRYSASSTLIRSTFMQALDYIEDNSIDILHIDGRHFESDVWEDFNSWKIKLSDRAIVLFHDTRVYDSDFGVYKVWRELTKEYPSIEFRYGCGLGVLGFGKNIPEKLLTLLSAPEEEKAAVEHAYARLGAGVLARFEANSLLEHRKYLESTHRDEKSRYESEIKLSQDRLRIAQDDININLEKIESIRKNQISVLQEIHEAVHASATIQLEIRENLSKNLEIAQNNLSVALSHEASHQQEYARRGETVLRLETELREERQSRAALLTSTSWRATSPLRLTKRIVSSPSRAIRALFWRTRSLLQSKPVDAPQSSSLVTAPETHAVDAAPAPYLTVETTEGHSSQRPAEANTAHLTPEVLAAEQQITPFFDSQWYLDRHPELADSGLSPAQHYLIEGEKLGHDPSPAFSVSFYLKTNPDVAASGARPFQHFINWGANEFRRPSPALNLERYARKHGLTNGIEALTHYVTVGDTDDLEAIRGVSPEEPLAAMGDPAALRGPVRMVVGIVISYESQSQIERIIKTTRLALSRCGAADGSISIFDNGNNGVFVDRPYIPADVKRFSVGHGIGFANGHNHLMKEAFASGAAAYITANPDGAFHPDCITYLLTMNQAQEGGALLEAIQFPEEHPKFYSPKTLETAWISGACLLISRRAYEAIGGFDPHIFLYCDDVDISWEAHYRGIKTLICPRALFYHDVSGRTHSNWRYREMLVSGRYMGHKWGSPEFMRWAEKQLLDNKFAHSKDELPSYDDIPVEPARKQFSDFSRGFSFSPVRW